MLLSAACVPLALAARAEEITRESAYNFIIVRRDPPIVSFRRVENGGTVSAIDLDRPERQVVPYTRYLFLPALLQPAPAAALSIGLGAGAFNRLFNLAFPASRLTTVEIDAMIVATAREFTGFGESANNRVEIADGRRFLRRNTAQWDWIVLDAFVRQSQIPPHLATSEFFQLLRSRLTPNGVFVFNLGGSDALVRRLAMTITSVFPGAEFWDVPDSGNKVGLATPLPDLRARIAASRPPRLGVDLARYDVDLAAMAHAAHDAVAVDPALVLTDDFAPTDYLNQE